MPPTRAAPSTRPTGGLRAAARLLEQVTRLNPTSLRDRVMAGRLWYRLWRQSGDAQAASRAAAHLKTALRIHATRDPQAADRLSRQELREIEQMLRAIGA